MSIIPIIKPAIANPLPLYVESFTALPNPIALNIIAKRPKIKPNKNKPTRLKTNPVTANPFDFFDSLSLFFNLYLSRISFLPSL